MLSRGPARGWMLGRRQIRVCRRQGRKPSGVVGKTSGGYLRRRRGLWPISQMLLLRPESNSPSPSQPSLACHCPCPIPAPTYLFPSVLLLLQMCLQNPGFQVFRLRPPTIPGSGLDSSDNHPHPLAPRNEQVCCQALCTLKSHPTLSGRCEFSVSFQRGKRRLREEQ